MKLVKKKESVITWYSANCPKCGKVIEWDEYDNLFICDNPTCRYMAAPKETNYWENRKVIE